MDCDSFPGNEGLFILQISSIPVSRLSIEYIWKVASITSGCIYVVYPTMIPFSGPGITNNLNVCLLQYCIHAQGPASTRVDSGDKIKAP